MDLTSDRTVKKLDEGFKKERTQKGDAPKSAKNLQPNPWATLNCQCAGKITRN